MITVDWGLSSFRAWAHAEDGTIVGRVAEPAGCAGLSREAFAPTLARLLAPLPKATVAMCGMVGSRQGWVEAPYVPCPAGLDEVAARLIQVADGIWLAPGLCCDGVQPDVMRGEECQILGSGIVDGVLCLPGTHSKWARIEGGKVRRFATFLTGEFYALLRRHSILAHSTAAERDDAAAFAAGVRRSRDEGGLSHHLFGVRTLDLFGRPSGAAYLSGLLIGAEIVGASNLFPSARVTLIGAPALAARYARALGDSRADILGEDMAARGLWAIWRRRIQA
ncbi:MAG: 2-dehydro-3-deoxygalactonokinase [Alphaproteobacteria bacterium]|nr:2-dehydro-3-deoxygalactonokinase [Alphaproteobacteria bacterium]